VAAPLLTNRIFLYDVVKGLLWAGGGMLGLVGSLFALHGDAELVLEMLPVLGLCPAGIFLLLVLVSAVLFGNRWHVRFTLDGRGVAWEQLRRTN
jgi:hypothetical protein